MKSSGGPLFFLALSPAVFGSVVDLLKPRTADPMELVSREADGSLEAQFNTSRLIARDAQNGQKCGPTAGGASCGAGWCCGPDGTCGQGGYWCTAPGCLWQYGPACDANRSPVGQNTARAPRPLFGNVPYGVNIQTCTQPGKVALTFDDGPYLYTTTILNTLKAAGIKATFFITANNGGKGEIDNPATGFPDILRRMYSEGHQIGSHTYSHQDLAAATHEQRLDQIIKNEIALTNVLGFFPTYLRTPYVSCNGPCFDDLKALGYHVAFFNLDTNDWKGDYVAAKQNYINALSGGKPASSSFIVLAHDIHEKTVADLVPYMIAQLKSLGYSTATMGECLNDPPENWYRDPATGQPIGHAKPLPSRSSSAPVLKATVTASRSAAANMSSSAASSASATVSTSVSTATSTSTSTRTSTSADFFGARSSGTPVAPPSPDTSLVGSSKSKKSGAAAAAAGPVMGAVFPGVGVLVAVAAFLCGFW